MTSHCSVSVLRKGGLRNNTDCEKAVMFGGNGKLQLMPRVRTIKVQFKTILK